MSDVILLHLQILLLFCVTLLAKESEPFPYLVLPVDADQSAYSADNLFRGIEAPPVIYTLDKNGIFHRGRPPNHPSSGTVIYSVLKNGTLIQQSGQYSIKYNVNKKGDLIPTKDNKCIYISERPTFFLECPGGILMPISMFFSNDEVGFKLNKLHLFFGKDLKESTSKCLDDADTRIRLPYSSIIPEKSCNGDINLFQLQNDGLLIRNPPDDYLPIGMKIKYQLGSDGSLLPYRDNGVQLTYITRKHGDLEPCESNPLELKTIPNTVKSFMLGEGGILAPVSEVKSFENKIHYYHNGYLVHASNQFPKIYSNTSIILLGGKTDKTKLETELAQIGDGPKFVCLPQKKRVKRTIEEEVVVEEEKEIPPCPYAIEDRGKRILIKPFVYEDGSIAIYKLTCKGHLQRLGDFREPDFNFEVQFHLLDNLILVPIFKHKENNFNLRYTLHENGTLTPLPRQKNSLKKAPASYMYYVLSANKELLPVRVSVSENRTVAVYFQNCLIHRITQKNSVSLKLFTTTREPLYAYVNGRIVISYADSTKPGKVSTWGNPHRGGSDVPSKCLYLIGPNQEKIKVSPKMNKNRISIIFVLDSEGVLHKSPKDDNKNLAIVSYMLLNKYILMKTEKPGCFIYLIDRQGNMLPYSYPKSKFKALTGSTVKFVLCEGDILVPIIATLSEGYLEYVFEDIVLFRRKVYTLEQVKEISGKGKSYEKISTLLHKDKLGRVSHYKFDGKAFRRFPSKEVDKYMIHSIGYFKVLPCGTLQNCQYPHADDDVMKVMLEANGDMTIVEGNKDLKYNDYCVSEDGDLIPVSVELQNNTLKFLKNNVVIHEQPAIPEKTKQDPLLKTPSGDDPFALLQDPAPVNSTNDGPTYMSIPIARSDDKTPEEQEDEKCERIRSIIRDVFENDPDIKNMELEMTESLMNEFCKLAGKCSAAKKTERLRESKGKSKT